MVLLIWYGTWIMLLITLNLSLLLLCFCYFGLKRRVLSVTDKISFVCSYYVSVAVECHCRKAVKRILLPRDLWVTEESCITQQKWVHWSDWSIWFSNVYMPNCITAAVFYYFIQILKLVIFLLREGFQAKLCNKMHL